MKKVWNIVYKKHKIKIVKNVVRLGKYKEFRSVPEYDAYVDDERITFGNVYTKVDALKIAKEYINKEFFSPGHIIFSQGVDLRTMKKPKSRCQVCGDYADVNWAGRCSLCETAEREEERRRGK